MEKFELVWNQKKIECTISYKNMKSIRIRVKNGNIYISAPIGIDREIILSFLEKNKEKLWKQIQQYVPCAQYTHHGFVYIFHQRYEICLRDVGEMKCQIHSHQLYVYHHSIEKCVEQYLKQVLYAYIEQKIKMYLMSEFDLPMPLIEIKKYKSRWGSCFYEKQKVSFHLSLVFLEKELIDYVIVHELSHFIYPNHSPMFYREVKRHMPDYKEREKRLKEKHI